MKNLSKKMLAVLSSLFIASSAYAWTPTVEVVRDSNNVLLRVGGWPTAAEMNEVDWSSYNVKMMILNQEFDVTAAVVSLFTSGHPSVNFTLNGHFDLSIALNPYFQIDPMLYPVRLKVCKLAIHGGECGDTAESLVKRDPGHATANATCYPSELCATGTGSGGAWIPMAGLSDETGHGEYGIPGIPVTFDKTTVITGFRAIVSSGEFFGLPTISWEGSTPRLNINSSLTQFAANPFGGDIINNASMVFSAPAPVPFGQPGGSCPLCRTTAYGEFNLLTPITLPAGSYVLSPYLTFLVAGDFYSPITTVDLGTDYIVGNSQPNVAHAITQLHTTSTGTYAIDIKGY